jgi:hypothetical protein
MAPRTTRLTQKTCEEIGNLVSDYLNGTLQVRIRRQFEQHLEICPDCVAFLNTFRETVSRVRSIRAEDMPETVRRNILEFLRSRARNKRPPLR